MFRRMLRTLTVTASTVAVLAIAAPAWAAPDPAPTDRINTIIGNITAWIVGLLVGVAALFLTIGGFRRLAAGGDPTEIEKSNSAFKNALIGYAMAVLAPLLLGIVQGWIGG